MDSWFLSAVKSGPGSEKKVSEDPMRRLCLGRLRNVPAQTVCILLVVLQAFFLNIHMVSAYADQKHWLWFIADALVIILFISSFYLKEWRLQRVAVKHKEESGFAKGLPFASLAWLVYGATLGARVSVIFLHDLEQELEIIDLKTAICGTAIICIFFTWGHHHNHESLARRASILSLVKLFTIDVLDTVDILDVLFETAADHKDFPLVLEDVILTVVTLNLVRPAASLTSLFIDHFGSHIGSLKVKIVKSLFELLLLNIPLLTIRVYLAVNYDESVSVFLVKNILGICFGLVEIYDCSYEIHSSKSEGKEELTNTTQLKLENGTNGKNGTNEKNGTIGTNGTNGMNGVNRGYVMSSSETLHNGEDIEKTRL